MMMRVCGCCVLVFMGVFVWFLFFFDLLVAPPIITRSLQSLNHKMGEKSDDFEGVWLLCLFVAVPVLFPSLPFFYDLPVAPPTISPSLQFLNHKMRERKYDDVVIWLICVLFCYSQFSSLFLTQVAPPYSHLLFSTTTLPQSFPSPYLSSLSPFLRDIECAVYFVAYGLFYSLPALPGSRKGHCPSGEDPV